MKRFVPVLLLGLAALALAACAGSQTGTASQAIEAYIKALVSKDKDAVVAAACARYEADAKLQADSFAAVTPALEGLSCIESGSDGDARLVTCKGVIHVTYNNEQQSLPLDGRTYLAIQESGEWRMCGYQ